MSTRRAPSANVFGPYSAEKAVLALESGEVVYCTRCPHHGRRTALVQKTDAIGRITERCPVCDGVAPARKALPDEIFRPQALIGKAQLLPPCPPGRLRCQCCARPVVGDARLCVKCELPGLSKKDVARMHREREDREAAAAPRRPKPELPRPLYGAFATPAKAPPPPKKKAPAKPGALAKAVAREVRAQGRGSLSIVPSPKVRTCLKCGAQSPHTGGPREIKDCRICTPRVQPTNGFAYKPKICACGCGQTFQPTGPRSLYAEGHHR